MNFLKKGTKYWSNLDWRSPLKFNLKKKKTLIRHKGSFDKFRSNLKSEEKPK